MTPWKHRSLLHGGPAATGRPSLPGGRRLRGTFLVESDEWLTSTSYVPKSKVVVAGVVEGQKDGRLL